LGGAAAALLLRQTFLVGLDQPRETNTSKLLGTDIYMLRPHHQA
jgi:hypothetical protein